MIRTPRLTAFLSATLALVGCAGALPSAPGATGAVATGPATIQALVPAPASIPISVAAGAATRVALVSTRDEASEVRIEASGLGALAAMAAPPAAAARAFELRSVRVDAATARAGRAYGLRQAEPVAVGDRRTYWVIRPSRRRGYADVQVATRAAYVGSACEVFIDERLGDGLDAQAALMGRAFDDHIFPAESRIFAPPIVPPGAPSKVALLVSPEVNNQGRDGTIGYFTARDLVLPAEAEADPELAHSNHRMMLYMAASVVQEGDEAEYLGTVAHEYQHLLNATHKLFGPTPAPTTEDTWLDEGLAMYAMQATGYGLGSEATTLLDHVRGYLDTPEAYSLTDWRANPGQAGYGAAYLFTVYLVDRLGEGIVRELLTSPRVGAENVEAMLAAHGLTFREAFRDWAGATMLAGDVRPPEARYTYRSITLPAARAGAGPGAARLTAVPVPGMGRLSMLPWSALFLTFTGRAAVSGATLRLPVGEGTGLDALVAAP
jgi:hypothetical protein